MQQRFCPCGQPVWVLYITRERGWRSFFYARGLQTGRRVETCPHCGAPLDIHRLR
ncbi:hypothetical protein [Nitratidesulfovibrio vulgaris]|uniref:Uncharacterized protein n=2 Tax=Nitratidesulfovibrio vulgaris TaxID=881 RepID=Q72BG1_NITV2|nr:hypothetical protein [Nitratidesulfovibrio vulgaris]GEB79406.1 hypothetical protein DDE01_08210 [Desulfovibrio desulfuricans]HBW14595.1 hypothetical protein [Desulfovibrio sp.]AAS96152.1 hypothetical protein DVU_1675 [Nitratidesulfovibrio vulgaris str. Hildenborough]ABM28430.1 conserved hypothetical protein [Nitratidesulfovibrio vulgaris DP4]ADP86770.1 hypothetical protein Deval_1617 [Nitratidesulfovibrio vulgaris RCH1]